MEPKEFKIALLIDSENISHKYIKSVMNEIAKYGKIVIARFYGNIQKLSGEWHQTALNYAIKPMHQYYVATAKNAADMAMALDAVEIMYQEKVNTFFLVTSDSDFTPLAIKLKEGGMHVIGVGNEKKVTQAFKSACNEFKYFEYLEDEEDVTTTNGQTIEIEQIIKDIIIENGANNQMVLSQLGNILKNRFSDFDTRKYGYKSLSGLVSSIKGLKTFDQDMYVELRTKIDAKDIGLKVIEIIEQNKTHEMDLNKLKAELEKAMTGFNFKEYGFSQFSKFISSIKDVSVVKNKAKLSKNYNN
jgi:uncharacterized protein (TIGR00288 family)